MSSFHEREREAPMSQADPWEEKTPNEVEKAVGEGVKIGKSFFETKGGTKKEQENVWLLINCQVT